MGYAKISPASVRSNGLPWRNFVKDSLCRYLRALLYMSLLPALVWPSISIVTAAPLVGCPDINGRPVIEAGRIITDLSTAIDYECTPDGYWDVRENTPPQTLDDSSTNGFPLESWMLVLAALSILTLLLIATKPARPVLSGEFLIEELEIEDL
jgi:hypothetical protein